MAQHCEHCPHPEGCPAWVGPEAGFLETNLATGEERLVQGCFYQVIPRMMAHVVRAANGPAAAFESARNEIVDGLRGVVGALRGPAAPAALEDLRGR